MEDELWESIKFSDIHEISDLGRVRNISTMKFLKITQRDNRTHRYVYINKRNHNVSELVAEYFIKNNDPINKIEIGYKDGDNSNIRYDNLIWKEPNAKGNRTINQGKGAIIQYDEDMNFIKEWEDMNKILANTKYGYSHLMKC